MGRGCACAVLMVIAATRLCERREIEAGVQAAEQVVLSTGEQPRIGEVAAPLVYRVLIA